MDVREKLAELLEEISYDKKLCWYDLWDMRNGAEDIADLLIAHGVTVQEWISVEDRLPEMEQNVLVADNGFIAVWTFYGDYWEDSHGWRQEFDEVTHWMPLPQPPKGD